MAPMREGIMVITISFVCAKWLRSGYSGCQGMGTEYGLEEAKVHFKGQGPFGGLPFSQVRVRKHGRS